MAAAQHAVHHVGSGRPQAPLRNLGHDRVPLLIPRPCDAWRNEGQNGSKEARRSDARQPDADHSHWCPSIPGWKTTALETIRQRNLAVQPWHCDYPPRRFIQKRSQNQDRRKCLAMRVVA
jgi:hypothetical protein